MRMRATGWLGTLLLLSPALGRAEEATFPAAEEVPSEERSVVEPPPSGGAALAPPAPPCPAMDCPECPTFEGVRDPDAVFRAFSVVASAERAQRIAGGVTGLLLGGASLGVVAFLDAEAALSDATPWYVLGGVTMGSGLLALFLPTQIERLAASSRAEEPGHSSDEAAQFELAWARLAAEREGQRKSGALLGGALGAAGLGFGVALLAGAFDLSDQDRQLYGTVVVSVASGVLVGSAVSYFVPSAFERSFAAYRAATSPLGASLSLVPAPGGAAVGVRGFF